MFPFSLIEQNFSWLKQEVAEMLARTQDANAMAIELNKEISFEPVVVARIVLGETSTRAKVNHFLSFNCWLVYMNV